MKEKCTAGEARCKNGRDRQSSGTFGAGSGEQEAGRLTPCSLLQAPGCLLADFQTPQQVEIELGIDPLDVIQQPPPPTDHPQQATPTGVVLGVQLQMLGHLG